MQIMVDPKGTQKLPFVQNVKFLERGTIANTSRQIFRQIYSEDFYEKIRIYFD